MGKRYPFGARYGRVSPFERQFFRDFAQTVCKAERKSDSFYPVSMQRSACQCSKRSFDRSFYDSFETVSVKNPSNTSPVMVSFASRYSAISVSCC